MRSLCLCGVLTLLGLSWPWRDASAQDTAAEEARRRAMVIAQLPPMRRKFCSDARARRRPGHRRRSGPMNAAV